MEKLDKQGEITGGVRQESVLLWWADSQEKLMTWSLLHILCVCVCARAHAHLGWEQAGCRDL